MNLPHPLLDPLEESITSGTFIDTKFYAFSRRDSSGRVGSARPLDCNRRDLNTASCFPHVRGRTLYSIAQLMV